MGKWFERLQELRKSPQGKNAIIFFAFLALSTVLWIVQVLNDDTQRDMRCEVRLNNVPDTLVRITPVPEVINVSVRAKGTQLLKFWWHRDPYMNIDFRTYKSGNKIHFSETALKAYFRNMVGGGSQVQSVTPDSLTIFFTSNPPIVLPVKTDVKVSLSSQTALLRKPYSLTDSVALYYLDNVPSRMRFVETQQVTFSDIKEPSTFKVALNVPSGMRAIPDSVDVYVDVEPMISKTRKVPIYVKNVPDGMKLIAMPSQVDVYYMVPMSIYKKTDSNPKFRVEADYLSIKDSLSEKIGLRLIEAPKDFTNVFLSTDSVDFILEKQ